MNEKLILDACCGSKMMWFDKGNQFTLFCDIREEEHVLCDGRVLSIKPDMKIDFRDMPFPDNHFKLVVFDPPHLKRVGQTSWLAKKYGHLREGWEADIKMGFDECMRVLDLNGVLIFKWSASQITVNEILRIIDAEPLFGHTSGRYGKTIWMCFLKVK